MTHNTKYALNHEQSVENLVKTIRIPPRPSLLMDVQQELSHADPSPRRLAKIIANDVALSASLLKLTNSSFFGLRLKARSVEHAVDLLGMNPCVSLMTGIIARHAIGDANPALVKFWDFSSKRAQVMSAIAKRHPVCSVDAAHTFGLFCDIGVPLLHEKFPTYTDTLAVANADEVKNFTEIEDQHHTTNHAAIGSLMARTWGLPEQVHAAILLHHDYAVLRDGATDEKTRGMIALALVAEYAIHTYHGEDYFAEWLKGKDDVMQFLGWSDDDVADQIDDLHELLTHAH
jgi:HD-like signal output (HDOD) protein